MTRKKKRTRWTDGLSKSDKQHLKEIGCGLVSKDNFMRTRAWQKENNVECVECECIERRVL